MSIDYVHFNYTKTYTLEPYIGTTWYNGGYINRHARQTMTDEMIAELCYVIVHDFQEEIIAEARAAVHHGYDPDDGYRKKVVAITEWARENEFPVVLYHAQRTLELIDAATFDPAVDI